MVAMMAVTTLLVSRGLAVIFSLFAMGGDAGARLLTRLELFSPAIHSQQKDRRKNHYQVLHAALVTIFPKSTGLTLPSGKSFAVG